MKATMKHRLDKLEVAEGAGDRRVYVLEGADGKPMAEAYREAGIEPADADMVIYLRGFGEAWRGRPAQLVAIHGRGARGAAQASPGGNES